jgi:hypothetical protein
MNICKQCEKETKNPSFALVPVLLYTTIKSRLKDNWLAHVILVLVLFGLLENSANLVGNKKQPLKI